MRLASSLTRASNHGELEASRKRRPQPRAADRLGSVQEPTFSSALVLFAHPDDAEFMCGGTIAKWARDGC
jgi:hypothetical protein